MPLTFRAVSDTSLQAIAMQVVHVLFYSHLYATFSIGSWPSFLLKLQLYSISIVDTLAILHSDHAIMCVGDCCLKSLLINSLLLYY